MKTVRHKKTRVNKDAVTIADLEREIADMRIGLAEQTRVLVELRKNYSVVWEDRNRLNQKLHEMNAALTNAQEEVVAQIGFQSRAHETIERLSKVMEVMVTTSVTVGPRPMHGPIQGQEH